MEAAPLLPDLDWPVGHVIDGQYEVRELIGKGGMGTVYRVRHWGWNVDLAVKVPLAHLVSDRTNKERFVLEAQTWIDLGVHPNIVQCWFVGEWEGLPLLFLDYLPMGSLKDFRKAGHVQPGQWEKIIDLMIQACAGLHCAHEHGLVHRDVKPANLLMSDQGRLCVTDFGLVKTTAFEAPGSSGLSVPSESWSESLSQDDRREEESVRSSLTLTATGTLLGTPEYGAPEQWTEARGVGIQADVYGVGGILFELCCGRRAFDDGTSRVNSVLLVGRHISKPCPDPRLFNPDTPAPLAALIMRCLEKKPADRPASMALLREELERIHFDLVGKAYPRPVPGAAIQRADALNNKALSLWNLGFHQRAFDAWREASGLDALHPETVYNRSLLQWRQGQIDEGEVLRRLTQVKTAYPHLAAYLGYFHLDRFSPQEAVGELEAALISPLGARNGLVWRALGDAHMYLQDFLQASEAYEHALERMPDDREAHARLAMARRGSRYERERTRFPLSQASLVLEHGQPVTAVAITQDARSGLHAHENRLHMWDLVTGEKRWSWHADHPDAGTTNIARLWVTLKYVLSLDTPKGRVWSLESGQVQGELEGRKRFFAVIPDQTAALTGAEDLECYLLPSGPVIRRCSGHTRPISCAAVSPDGQVAISGSADRTVRVWDLETGACLRVLEGHTDLVETVAFSGDGTLALSGGRDRTVRVWLLATGDCLYTLEHGDEVRRLRLTADSRYAVVSSWSVGQKDTLDVWDLASGARIFSRPGGSVVTLLQGGPWALVGSRSARPGTLQLWEIPSGRLLRSLAGHPGEVHTLAVSRDDRWAVTGGADGTLRVWEIDWGSRVYELSLVVNRTHDHSQVESTQELFRKHLEQAMRRHSANDPGGAYRHLNEARQVPGYIRDPRALSLNGELLGRLLRKSVSAVWQLRSCTAPGPVAAVALTRDGSFGLSASGKILHLWELSSGSCLRGFTGHTDLIKALCVTADGSHAVSGSLDGTLRVWNLGSGDCLEVWKVPDALVKCVAVNDDFTRIVATTKGHMHIWNARSGELLHTLDTGPVGCLSVSGDGRLAMTGLETGNLRLWNLGKAVLADRAFAESGTCALALCGDGRYALSAAQDYSLRLWQVEDGIGQAPMVGHTDRVNAVALSWDGRVAMSASHDGTLRVWDTASATCLETIRGDAGPILAMDMSPDARFALAAGADQKLRLWELDWELNPDAPATSLSNAWRKSGLINRLTSLFRRPRK